MNINQKRALYESIMREVGREVRKSLYEQRLSDYKASLNEGKVQQTIVAALAALQMFGGNNVKAAINWDDIDGPTKAAVQDYIKTNSENTEETADFLEESRAEMIRQIEAMTVPTFSCGEDIKVVGDGGEYTLVRTYNGTLNGSSKAFESKLGEFETTKFLQSQDMNGKKYDCICMQFSKGVLNIYLNGTNSGKDCYIVGFKFKDSIKRQRTDYKMRTPFRKTGLEKQITTLCVRVVD